MRIWMKPLILIWKREKNLKQWVSQQNYSERIQFRANMFPSHWEFFSNQSTMLGILWGGFWFPSLISNKFLQRAHCPKMKLFFLVKFLKNRSESLCGSMAQLTIFYYAIRSISDMHQGCPSGNANDRPSPSDWRIDPLQYKSHPAPTLV